MDDPGFDIYYNHFYETVCEKKEKIMLGILGLILLFSVIIVGGERMSQFYIFSKGGFTNGFLQAQEREEVRLIMLEDLYK